MAAAATPGAAIRRVVTTRDGGVSRAPYDSFNLGDHVGDDPRAVAANRARLAEHLGLPGDRVIWMQQTHSTNIAVVDGPRTEAIPDTDGIVTAQPGLALAVLTADCVPVLLADDEAGVIAAVHAGRVGARDGIIGEVLRAMVDQGARPERTSALLGPAASGNFYEVPAEMADDVERHLPGSRCQTEAGTPGLDLRAGITRQLQDAGVTAIVVDPRCTIADEKLFSHRRTAPTGRLASVIWREA
ncbi:MAG: peptidoglycan editing factor PgeF [Gordonia sp. (in: high G+C Gram-positive bacteria)]|uniref:peptidoglycan editing factor PgeF n=1 Tax=Gordonia sp. (in: high G+C Gram-positive bacteria) TaxID=84139 RepID=UPI0039E3BFA1